ncbi:MAG: tetratricopeptide repeat protein [Planctomycetota bacterium]
MHRSSGIRHYSSSSYGHSRGHTGSRHYRTGRRHAPTHRYLGVNKYLGRHKYRSRYGYARPQYRSYYIRPYSHYYTRPYHRSYYYGYPYYYSLPRYRYYYFGYPGYYVSPYSHYYYDYRYESPPDVPDEPKYDPNDPYRDVREETERQETREIAEQAKAAAQQAKQTAEQAKRDVQYIKANQYLDNVADAFAEGDYAKAADHAARGLRAEPENAVLPFVYSQSLFANAHYRAAADVLREALRMTHIIDEHGVYYSAGFYPDQDTLPEQIDRLSEAADAEPDRADLKLLLGYQLMGMGALDEALGPLQKIQYDYVNGQAAKMLIEVLEKSRRPDLDQAPQQDNY